MCAKCCREARGHIRIGLTDVIDTPSPEKNNGDRLMRARQLVVDYFNERVEKTDNVRLTLDDVYVVWFVKVLQNWKALVSTEVPDGMYYELTYNGDKREVYLDAYKKFDNKVIVDPI